MGNTHKFPTKNLRYLTKNPRSQTRSRKPEPAQQVQEVLEVADTEALVEVPPEVLLEVLQLVKETTVSQDNKVEIPNWEEVTPVVTPTTKAETPNLEAVATVATLNWAVATLS